MDGDASEREVSERRRRRGRRHRRRRRRKRTHTLRLDHRLWRLLLVGVFWRVVDWGIARIPTVTECWTAENWIVTCCGLAALSYPSPQGCLVHARLHARDVHAHTVERKPYDFPLRPSSQQTVTYGGAFFMDFSTGPNNYPRSSEVLLGCCFPRANIMSSA